MQLAPWATRPLGWRRRGARLAERARCGHVDPAAASPAFRATCRLDRVPPWDHLRENRYPSWVHPNRLTPEQYRETFGAMLDVVHFQGIGLDHDADTPEGERCLTPEVVKELADYPREWLPMRSWCMLCKRG